MMDLVGDLVTLSAAIAAREPEALAAAMDRAAASAGPTRVEECVLQSYLFLGYPIALNTMSLWRERSGMAPGPPAEDEAEWPGRGEAVCRTVYAGRYEGLRANVRALHPDLERWMVVEGYGKVLGRPGLPLVVRELCAVAILTVLDAPRQLHSHLRGALNAGASAQEVDMALALARHHASESAGIAADTTWARVRARRKES
jgi:4-carboxymuconolactone decarboxylase